MTKSTFVFLLLLLNCTAFLPLLTLLVPTSTRPPSPSSRIVAMAATATDGPSAADANTVRQELGARITAALDAHKNGLLDAALAAYEEVLPDVRGTGKLESTLRNNAAAIHMGKGDNAAARTHFTAAVASDPDNPQSHYNLAVILTSKFGEHGQAIRHCGTAIKLDPTHTKAHHLMGNILQDLGKDAEAQKYFVAAEALAQEQGGHSGSADGGGSSSSGSSSSGSSSDSSDSRWARFPVRLARVGDVFTVDVSDGGSSQSLTLECISARPLVLRAANVVSAEECAHIMQRASARLERSHVMGGGGGDGGAATVTVDAEATVAGESAAPPPPPTDAEPYRSSYNAWLHADEVTSALQRRLAALTGLPLRLFQQRSEELQVVKYGPGGQFKVHQDSSAFNPRLLTALLYLNDVSPTAGGETWFPYADNGGGGDGDGDGDERVFPETVEDAIAAALRWHTPEGPHARPGLSVAPKRGDAIIFFNHQLNGQLDPAAVHAGLPVVGGADTEKWIANYWLDNDDEILFG